MKITILGDIALTGIISTQPERNNDRYSQIIPFLLESDLVFANLEVPVRIDGSQNEYKRFIHFSLPDPTREILKMLNISCVSLANNHIYDCKMSGLKSTINILDELGIYHTGAGWLQEHVDPVIIDAGGYKVGFLSYVDKSTNPATEFFPELLVNYIEPEKVHSDVTKLKVEVDKVICSLHWGVDYSFYHTEVQRVLANSFIEAGADIIMGHHSHTLQPFESYKTGQIFYGLGGMTFGDFEKNGQMYGLYRKTKSSAIFEINETNMIVKALSIKEKKGNFIVLDGRNVLKDNKRRWMFYRLKQSNKSIGYLFLFKERVLDRIYEYFFGYYMNPIKRLTQVRNIKKLGRLFK